MKQLFLFLSFLLFPSFAFAQGWVIDPSQSEIRFSGSHAGNDFSGTFGTWKADIIFNPEALEQATAAVEIDLASAVTGNKTYDGTLPQGDWLDSAKGTAATFTAQKFTHLEGERYQIDGVLNLRGVEVPVTLYSTIAIRGDVAKVSASARLQRLDFGIGKGSDSSGEWVSLEIPVEIKLTATRAQ